MSHLGDQFERERGRKLIWDKESRKARRSRAKFKKQKGLMEGLFLFAKGGGAEGTPADLKRSEGKRRKIRKEVFLRSQRGSKGKGQDRT